MSSAPPRIDADTARALATSQRVCVRPLLRRVTDRATGAEDVVPIPCGSRRDSVCPSCAHRAKVLRMQQCAEGWHLIDEPDTREPDQPDGPVDDEDQVDDDQDGGDQEDQDEGSEGSRRRRSTRRRQDVPNLPKVPQSARTVGQVFRAPTGREYRPSMFLTVTLPSYGPVDAFGVPRHPGSYDYRRAALDALHFAKLVDRLWQNLRRCAGYKVQYFATVEPQKRLAPHLHAAIRGAIPRHTLRPVVAGTYYQLWWPAFDRPVYVDRVPEWTGTDYADRDTGEVLPTWEQALDQLDADPDARPAHVLRFGTQLDARGLIAPSEDADRAVRYLTKYLTKSIADAYTDPDDTHPAYEAHVDRLHEEVRWLPCSERCANWLRYGIQPDQPGPGLTPGRCSSKAHDRENLGLGGRRVLVSRQWSGKTLTEHRADRAAVVREALLSAGLDAPNLDRMAASVTMPDGSPRFLWSDTRPDQDTYVRVVLASIVQRQQWRALYDAAKTLAGAVDGRSATGTDPPDLGPAHSSASPDNPPHLGRRGGSQGWSEAESLGTPQAPLTPGPKARTSQLGGGRAPHPSTTASRSQPPSEEG